MDVKDVEYNQRLNLDTLDPKFNYELNLKLNICF